jgi:hypothetical protein
MTLDGPTEPASVVVHFDEGSLASRIGFVRSDTRADRREPQVVEVGERFIMPPSAAVSSVVASHVSTLGRLPGVRVWLRLILLNTDPGA